MAFSTYTELQAAISNWMHRNNLTGDIPDFIRLAELRIRTRLQERVMEVAASFNTTAGVEYALLPSDLVAIRSLSIPSVEATLDYMSPDEFNQQFDPAVSGQPRCYTIIGEQVYFGPTPDAVYAVMAMYRFDMPALSDSAPTNSLLAKWPNIYLFGALTEAAEFCRDFVLADRFTARFGDAVDGANVMEFNKTGPMRARTDVRTW